jgi:methyl-accepting chemotaxis protein
MNRLLNVHNVFYGLSFLMLAAGLTAIISFFDLGGAVDRILKENMRSVEAAEKMASAVFRFSVVLSLSERHSRDSLEIEREVFNRTFLEACRDAENNLTIPGEKEIVDGIRDNYEKYASLSERYVTEPPSVSGELSFELSSISRTLRNQIDKLLDINRKAMTDASERAKRMARERSIWMILLSVIGLLATFYTQSFIQHSISMPLRDISRVLRRVNMSHYDLKVRRHFGEFEEISEQINDLIEKIAETASESRDARLHFHRIASALMESFQEPTLLFDLRKEMIFANRLARPIVIHAEAGKLLRRITDAIGAKEERVGVLMDGKTYFATIRTVETETFKTQGFLVRLETE